MKRRIIWIFAASQYLGAAPGRSPDRARLWRGRETGHSYLPLLIEKIRIFLIVIALGLAFVPGANRARPAPVLSIENAGEAELLPYTSTSTAGGFTFAIAADMRFFAGPGGYYTSQYFRGA
ncbi:MAG: hypothetical protein U9R05_07505, partial [Chloroflexota bacterium]|nr:hypothetical protein [Chloroflexota bacterium]